MNRAIISQRITSILAEIERLNNALYAMNTTDIQRYPDNYEVLSTDAALRAERITCRLRHLIYATTRTYLVETVTKISSSDWSYLSSTTDNRMTLLTCVAGDSSQRWCVQAVQAS